MSTPSKNVDLGSVKGETLGVVGESGSGKSTLGRQSFSWNSHGGKCFSRAKDVSALKGEELKRFRTISRWSSRTLRLPESSPLR